MWKDSKGVMSIWWLVLMPGLLMSFGLLVTVANYVIDQQTATETARQAARHAATHIDEASFAECRIGGGTTCTLELNKTAAKTAGETWLTNDGWTGVSKVEVAANKQMVTVTLSATRNMFIMPGTYTVRATASVVPRIQTTTTATTTTTLAPSSSVLWSAELTSADNGGTGTDQSLGYKTGNAGDLSVKTFTYGGVDYTVAELFSYRNSVRLDTEPAGISLPAGTVLSIISKTDMTDSFTGRVGDARTGPHKIDYRWPIGGLKLESGTIYAVSLVLPATPPTTPTVATTTSTTLAPVSALWSAELTSADNGGTGTDQSLGYKTRNEGALSNTTFTYGGVDYTVAKLFSYRNSVRLDTEPAGISLPAGTVMSIISQTDPADSFTGRVGDARTGPNKIDYRWPIGALTFTVGTIYDVSLTLPAATTTTTTTSTTTTTTIVASTVSWSANLESAQVGGTPPDNISYGYKTGYANGALSDTTFTYDGVDYTVERLFSYSNQVRFDTEPAGLSLPADTGLSIISQTDPADRFIGRIGDAITGHSDIEYRWPIGDLKFEVGTVYDVNFISDSS